jgi:hypothetical protein
MSLQALIKDQVIKIKSQSGALIDWEKREVCIYKETNSKINGKRQKFKIILPIDFDEIPKVVSKHNTHEVIERIEKEVENAFENAAKRGLFIADLADLLRGFSQHDIEKRTEEMLERLAKYFELEWTHEEIKRYVDDALVLYIRVYKNKTKQEYYIRIEQEKKSGNITLEIGENSGHAKEANRMGR